MERNSIFGLKLRGASVLIAVVALAIALVACGGDTQGASASDVSALNANLSAQSAQIEALTSQVGNLQSELAEAQKMEADDVADLRASIEDIREQDKMTVQFDDSALKSEIGELHDIITKLEGRVNSIEDEGMDADTLGQELAALSSAVAGLQERMTSDEDDERLDSEHIESLNAELSGVLKALTELQGSGAGSQIEEVIARLDWLENAVAPAYTRAYVEEAILRYNREGRQATLDYYNTVDSVNGDLYLFVLDEDYKIIVQPTIPANIGLDIRGPVGTDITGKNYGPEFVTADSQGKWIDYVYLNPAANFTFERKHTWAVRHDNLIFASGWYERTVSLDSTPAEYSRALVHQAIARYDAIGKDTILSYYNSAASVHGPYYVFVVDSSDLRSVANGARPDLVGTIPDRIDPTGYNYSNDLASATKEGGWISYVILNPNTGEQQRKHSWIALHDGLIFGSGWYESGSVTASKDNPPAFTRALVEQAIARYESDGREATVAYYNSPGSVDEQWYVFIGDENDIMLAHATVPENVGKHFNDVISPDGYPAGAQVAAAAKEGGAWTTYTYLNTVSGNAETKHSWVTRHNGMIFGSGWYEEGPPRSDAAAYTKAFVERAINLYDDLGREGTVAFYNSPGSVDGEWYTFIADENDVMIAHATVPDNVGKSPDEIVSPDGYPAGAQVAAAATEGGAWTSYTYLNPATGNVQTKHSWVIRHDGLVFGSGWYEDGPSKDDPDAYTQAFVQRALNLYDDLGRDGTVAYYNSEESIDGQWYVFIIGEDDNFLAHAATPERVGTDVKALTDANGFAHGQAIADEASEEGSWLSYARANPVSGEDEPKRSWIIRHDGLIFGSGWYKSDE